MKPYYQDGAVTIFHGDCREILPGLEPVDLVLTDPPYGLKINGIGNSYGHVTRLSRLPTSFTWDDKRPAKKIFYLLFSKSKNQIIWGGNFFSLQATKCFLIWDKREDLPDVPFSPVEFAWTSFNKQPKIYRLRQHGFIRDSQDEQTGHPTQKPTELFMRCLRDFGGETILDPFMGSGTTLRAAKELGRKAIGIEIEEKYCEIAARRMAQEVLDLSA